MRFPNETLPTAVPAVDPTEVSANAAVAPVRRVGNGTRGVSAQVGSQIPVGPEDGHAYYEREENERRKMCRRIYHLPVLLDTRSGEERRKETRRLGDKSTHIAEEA